MHEHVERDARRCVQMEARRVTHILPQAVLVPDLAARAGCSAMLDS